MAFSYGDQWSNMIQPFWALALLGITGLRARDILGYTTAVMLFTAPLFIVPLLLL
jgi:short-chain fatty acids transporter